MPERRCVLGCRPTRTAYLHTFPSNVPIREKWLEFCHYEPTGLNKYTKLCSRHFLEDCFENYRQVFMGLGTRLVLKETAIPSVYTYGTPVPRKLTRDVGCVTDRYSIKDKGTQKFPGGHKNKETQTRRATRFISVNVDCLQQLFQTCFQCRSDCTVDLNGDEWHITVLQRCKRCNHLHTWDNQTPKNNNEAVRKQSDSQAKKLVSQPRDAREGDVPRTDALGVMGEEEVTNGDMNTAPTTRKRKLGGEGDEGTNKGIKLSRPCEAMEGDMASTGDLGIMVANSDMNTTPITMTGTLTGEGDKGSNKGMKESEKGELLPAEVEITVGHSDSETEDNEGEVGKEDDNGGQGAKSVTNEDDREEEEEEEEEEGENDCNDEDWEMEDGDGDDDEDWVEDWVDMEAEEVLGKKEMGPSRIPGSKVLCPKCGVLYTSRKHKCHPKMEVQCPDCERYFQSNSSLSAHKSASCKGKKKYPCKFCLHPCETWTERQIHQKGHPRKQPYLCLQCPQTFDTAIKRNEHVREQHPQKVECPTCHQDFKGRDIWRHLLTHSDDKPYKCTVCSRPFAQPSQLKSHIRTHTGEKPYKCEFCPKSFNHNVSRKAHIRRDHQGELQHHPGAEGGPAEQRADPGPTVETPTPELRKTET